MKDEYIQYLIKKIFVLRCKLKNTSNNYPYQRIKRLEKHLNFIYDEK